MSGQRGSLGISIAGGKGSLPYKDHDEVSAVAEELALLSLLQQCVNEDDVKQQQPFSNREKYLFSYFHSG